MDSPASPIVAPPAPADSQPQIPDLVDVNEFHKKSLPELYALGEDLQLRVNSRTKHQLVFDILTYYSRRGARIEAEGCLEIGLDFHHSGTLRYPLANFRAQPDDISFPQPMIRRFDLRRGNRVRVSVRAPREREKLLVADEVISIEGIPADAFRQGPLFDKLTPLFPKDRIILENPALGSHSCRVVDLVAPLGKGQRGLICAPPRGGKTILLKQIAQAIAANHPEVELLVLLLDERPEEVSDFKEAVPASVYSSTFDEAPTRHVELAEFVSERARRLVELGRDVVILLDSLTRLARGYNNMMGGGGRILSGGLDAKALQKPKKFFGAARNIEEGGSLTVLATALIETESRMDEVIFEEFKGTGNMELHLDREMAEQRVFPAIHFNKSGTRKDDLLYHPDEFRRVALLRRQLAQMPAPDAIEVLLRNIRATQTNAEMLLKGLQLLS
jgi:transcription termination factor Rho